MCLPQSQRSDIMCDQQKLAQNLHANCWALTGCLLLQVWPIANTIAFRYIPQDLRIIYQNVLGVAMVHAAMFLLIGNCSAASGMNCCLWDELHRVERASVIPCRAPT